MSKPTLEEAVEQMLKYLIESTTPGYDEVSSEDVGAVRLALAAERERREAMQEILRQFGAAINDAESSEDVRGFTELREKRIAVLLNRLLREGKPALARCRELGL